MVKTHVQGVDHIGMVTTDFQRTLSFYEEVLGFEVDRKFSYRRGDGERHVAYLRLGNLPLEIASTDEAPASPGRYDHLALETADLDTLLETFQGKYTLELDQGKPFFLPEFWQNGSRYFNLITPTGEKLEFCTRLGHTYSRKRNVWGFGHTSLAVVNLERSLAFYQGLGFTVVDRNDLFDPADPIRMAMIQNGACVMEVFQLTSKELDGVAKRGAGSLHHLSLAVDDPLATYYEMQAEGCQLSPRGVMHFANSYIDVTYFNAVGPDGEILEFSSTYR